MMKKYRRNIIFLVFFHLGVLLIPTMVKSLHHHNFSLENGEKKGIFITNIQNEICLICEYQFPINEVPKSQNIQFFNFYFAKLISSTIQKGFLTGIDNLIPPRAPPVMI
jgi:hypothetical protein